jgi:hypothetical protein
LQANETFGFQIKTELLSDGTSCPAALLRLGVPAQRLTSVFAILLFYPFPSLIFFISLEVFLVRLQIESGFISISSEDFNQLFLQIEIHPALSGFGLKGEEICYQILGM